MDSCIWRPAAGYLRVSSTTKQHDNHSPAVQREAIERLAAREGLRVVLWDADEERGRHTQKRAGYVRILDAAARGQVRAIIVNHSSRFGRRTAEMVNRLDELDRAGIEFWSCQQGRLRSGFVSTLFFALDEEFCRTLARTVRPAREEGARKGVHQGPTPYGYRRLYPEWDGRGPRPPGLLLPDETERPIVCAMFERYESGIDSCRSLARWLNEGGTRGPGGKDWCVETVWSILRNPVYIGKVTYDRRPRGYYERAPEGSYFEAKGRHEGLVDEGLFARVQQRLRAMGPHPSAQRTAPTYEVETKSGRGVAHTYLASGLLWCRGCKGPMRPHSCPTTPGHKGSYLCRNKRNGTLPCTEPGYRMDLAHEALLREVGRLRGSPWTTGAERRLMGGDEGAERARALRRAIDDEQRRLARHMDLLTYRKEPGPAELAAYEALVQQIEGRIAARGAQLREVERVPDRMVDLRALHEELTHTELRDLLGGLDAERDEADRSKVRRIVVLCVQSATLAERKPERYSRWLRMDVTWTPRVGVLLREGVLRLEDATGQLLRSQELLDDP